MKLVISGAGGKMGRALIEAAQADPGFEVAAALDAPGSAAVGCAVGGVRVETDIAAAASRGDAFVDFTRPEGTLAHVAACVAARKAMVIGTTGFSAAQHGQIEAAAKRVAIVLSPNFAVGVNAVFKLAETAARILGDDFDVEIVEAHHRHKVDAPSGTALRLGEIIASALHRRLDEVAVHGRHGDTGERAAKAIGFHAIRGGDIVGEHTVIFAGAGERVEVAVRSQSRATYALGALRAAKWLHGRAPGLYEMADVLGLK